MSNVSIFEKKWIELVFEGKNKEYGAYQLRQEHPKTTLKAFFFAIFSISFVSGMAILLSSFSPKPVILPTAPVIDSVIKVSVYPEIDQPELPEINPHKKVISDPIVEPEFFKPIVVETAFADQNVAKNDDLINRNQPETENNGNGNGTEPATLTSVGGGNGTDDATPKTPSGPVPNGILDAQPEFPGGMKKFYDYVATNFKELDIDNVEKITVMVSFVIEKDGSMTDIRVLRNPGYGVDAEAIRVLKSLKTKWKAGVLNGQNVRTQYTMPITVKIN